MSDVTGRDVDGGWAWVVLFAAGISLALQDAYLVAVGIFQVEFLEAFSGSQGYVALICALGASMQVILGPVAGVMTDFWGHRVTVMVGGAIKGIALVSASFSQDLFSLLLLFGIMCGLGAGLCYTPSVTVISTHFHKYRTVANGLTLAAPGVGVLCGPYLLQWLIGSYGWRLAMAAFGGLMAQICVLGALFYPHRPHNPSADRPPSKEGPAMNNSDLKKDTTNSLFTSNEDHHKTENEVMSGSRTKLHGSRTELQILLGSRTELAVKMGSRTDVAGSRTEIGSKTDMVGSRTDTVGSRTDLESKTGSRAELRCRPMPRGVLPVSEFGSVVLNQSVECLRKPELPSPPLSFKQRVTELLSHKFMWIICLNQLLMMSGHAINVVLYPAFVRSVGVPFHDVPALYTAYGVTISVGRIAGGFLFSTIPNHLLHVFLGLQVALAVVFALLPVSGVSLPALFVNVVLVGLTYGPSFLLLSPIILLYVRLPDLSIAFGLIMLSGGVAFVFAPAIAGWTYDILHSYSVSYYIAGSTVGAGTLPLLLLLLVKDLEPPQVKATATQGETQMSANQIDCEALARDTTKHETANRRSCDISARDCEQELTNEQSCDILARDCEHELTNRRSCDTSAR